MSIHRTPTRARNEQINRDPKPPVRKNRLSATMYMKDRPHFVWWTVKDSNGTRSFCFPADQPPFDLGQIFGIVDASGVFNSTDCSHQSVDGYDLHAVRIEQDHFKG